MGVGWGDAKPVRACGLSRLELDLFCFLSIHVSFISIYMTIKGIVNPKMNLSNSGKFVSSSEQIWINVVLYHLLTSGSSLANGCHQYESPADRNLTIIHK